MAELDDRPSRIDYRRLVQIALRDVVRRVLLEVAEVGVEAPHQLYLTFSTTAPGVEIPGFLREAYPDTLTVVLENQFWDLEADEQGFSVTLRFGGVPHRIHVPFDALKTFVDPGVEFGLSFEHSPPDADDPMEDVAEEFEEQPAPKPAGTGDVVELAAFRKRRPAPPE